MQLPSNAAVPLTVASRPDTPSERGSAFPILKPALDEIGRLRSEWDKLSASDAEAAIRIERHVTAIAQVACDPHELSRQTDNSNTAGEYLANLLSAQGQTSSTDELLNRGRHAEGRFHYQDAFEAYCSLVAFDPSNLEARSLAGRTAFRLGLIQKAVDLFHSAPKYMLVNASIVLRCTFLNNYASALRAFGSIDLSRAILELALEETSPHRLDMPDEYSMLLSNLGTLLSRTDGQRASEMYREAIAVRSCLNAGADVGLAQIQNNYAEFMRRAGDMRAAKSLHASALRTRLEVLGSVNLVVCESFNNLGGIARDESDHRTAERCLKTTVEITEGLLGRRHFQYALSLNNFGMLLAVRKKYEEALIYIRNAVDILLASSLAGTEITHAVEKNLMNVELSAARQRTSGPVIRDSIFFGPVSQSVVTTTSGGIEMKPRQHISGSRIRRGVRMESDVNVDQEFLDSTAESLDMIIKTKRGREKLGADLEKIARSAEEAGECTSLETQQLREAAVHARQGNMNAVVEIIKKMPKSLLSAGEKIGTNIASKVIERALGLE